VDREPETVPCGICGKPTTMTGTCRCDGCWELEHRVEAQPVIALRIALMAINRQHAAVMVEQLQRETHQLRALVEAARSQEPAVAAFWAEVAALPPAARAEFDRFMMILAKGRDLAEEIGGEG
jgi:hypothetical protein